MQVSTEKSEIIKDIEKLKFKGEYEEASEKIEDVLKSESYSPVEKIHAVIQKCWIGHWTTVLFGYDKKKLTEVYNSLEEALVQAKNVGDTLLIFETYTWKTGYLWNIGRYEEYFDEVSRYQAFYQKLEEDKSFDLRGKKSYIHYTKAFQGYYQAIQDKEVIWDFQKTIDLFEEAYLIAKEFEEKEIMMSSLFNLTWVYIQIGNIEKSLDVNNKFLKIAEELENNFLTAYQLQRIGWDYNLLGDNDSFLHYTKKSLSIKEELGNEKFLASSYASLGVYYGNIGEFKEALEYSWKAHNIKTENGKKTDEPGWLNRIASFYNALGEVDESLECWEKLYKILIESGEIHYEEWSYTALQEMANIHLHKGEIDKSLKLTEQALDLHRRVGNKLRIAENLQLLSKIYEKKGILEKSIEYLDKALEVLQEYGNKVLIAGSYYNYIILTSKYDKNDLAKEYFKKLEKIAEEIDQKNIKRLVLITEGILLKCSKETEDRLRAEVLFDQLLQEDIGYYLKIEILLQLCELLLSELKSTSNERYLEKLQKTVTVLLDIGTENNFPLIIVECLWFKSQLSLLNLDIKSAQEQLTKALGIAENKGLDSLALKMTKSKEQIFKQKIELEKLGDTSSISKRMEIIRVENGFNKLKDKDVFDFDIEKVETTGKLFSLQI